MDLLEHLHRVRQALSKKAERRRLTQLFSLEWRSGMGSEIVVGWPKTAEKLGIKENTLASRLSSSDNRYVVKRINPFHGEYDLLTVSKIKDEVGVKRSRGRPVIEPDWERLGSEAPNSPSSKPSYTKGKRQNRDTDEKQETP